MKRLMVVLILLCIGVLAQRFAGFTVQPSGPQELDLSTGITTLAQGGSITDNQRNLKLQAKYIQYKDGEFYKAREASFKSKDGDFSAVSLEFQQKADTLKLDTLRFSSKDLKGISAKQGVLFKENILVLKGEVRSGEPSLEASLTVIDTSKSQALVLGPFTYKDGLATLKGQKADSTLLLSFSEGKVKAITRVPPEVLGRLKPYADKL